MGGTAMYHEMELSSEELNGCRPGLMHIKRLLNVLMPPRAVHRGTWLSELAYWLEDWKYRGLLSAVGTVQCILVDHNEVRNIILTRNLEYKRCMAKFAAYRVKTLEVLLERAIEPTDLSHDELVWEDLGADNLSGQTVVCERIATMVHEMGV